MKALTDRETEVMVLLSEGRSRREIADELCLAIQTIDNHLDGAFNKLGAINAPHAVRLFLENQVITPSTDVLIHSRIKIEGDYRD